jgi:hypothetical protein
MTIFRKTIMPAPQAETPTVSAITPPPEVVTTETSLPDPATPAAAPATMRSGSKGTALLELLQRSEGASLDEMIERTGWQGHTVRAAMTGLRKKGHAIDKRMTGNCTVWFIAA